MKVTFLAQKLDQQGGSSFSLDLMARRLSMRGHSVRILTTNIFQENNLSKDRPYTLIDNVVESDSTLSAPFEIKKILDKYEYITDIYHVFNPQYLAIAGWYRQSGTIPVVGRLNAYDGFCTNPSLMDDECYKNCTIRKKIQHDDREIKEKPTHLPQYLYQHVSPRFINLLDSVFAISPTIKEVYSYNGVNSSLINVIPNFYDPEFVTNVNTTIDFSPNQFSIFYAGRLREEKGIDVLIEAAASMDTSNTVINIVGDGPQREELETQVESNDLSNIVRFHGRINHEQLSTFYTKSDVFVHPCRWPEPFGRTMLEALQCNCPPVVSDIGAAPWVIGDAGRTFNRKNQHSLANELSDLQNSPTKLERLKSNCGERIERYSPGIIIEEIEEQYQRITKDDIHAPS